MMDDNLLSRLEELRQTVSSYETLSKKALGFGETITHRGILFNVSLDFVIADLSPLALFNLVEHVDEDGADAAVVRLYERFAPLLSCRHQWLEPTTALDQDGQSILYEPLQVFGRVFVCAYCTACAIQTAMLCLPTIGRSTDPLLENLGRESTSLTFVPSHQRLRSMIAAPESSHPYHT